jgi:predicted O-methyltransferase YrrM
MGRGGKRNNASIGKINRVAAMFESKIKSVHTAVANPSAALEFAKRLILRNTISRLRAKQLESTDESITSKLGCAFSETISETMNSNEREWVNRLENVRERIDSNDKEMTISDYGAGSQNGKNKSREDEGILKKHVKVKDLPKSDYNNCLLMMKIIRHINPNQVLEMGTSVGISASYQSAALELNNHGHLITIEGSEDIVSIAEHYFGILGLGNINIRIGTFDEELPSILSEIDNLDMVFVDGHHDGDATVQYYNQIISHLSKGSVIIFDDIHWSEDMHAAWNEIRSSEQISTTIDTGKMGICCVGSADGENITLVV